jgi:hypothetical protein
MRLYEPINDKPPLVGSGGLTWQGGCLTLKLQFKRDGSLTDCSSPVNHPTTPNARYWENSLKPVGEERGAILKSVQRPPIYGHAAHSWEACRRTGKPVKSCQLRVRLRKGHHVSGEWTRPWCACLPPEFHNRRVIGGKR